MYIYIYSGETFYCFLAFNSVFFLLHPSLPVIHWCSVLCVVIQSYSCVDFFVHYSFVLIVYLKRFLFKSLNTNNHNIFLMYVLVVNMYKLSLDFCFPDNKTWHVFNCTVVLLFCGQGNSVGRSCLDICQFIANTVIGLDRLSSEEFTIRQQCYWHLLGAVSVSIIHAVLSMYFRFIEH